MIKAYFRNIRTEILREISLAERSLKVAVAWFTNNELFDALLTKCRQGNITVELIIINDSINIKTLGLDFNQFIQKGGILFFGDRDTLMHHKFCLVDDKVLINGSYNWTFWAETKNNENITIIRNESEAIESFYTEFQNLKVDKQPLQIVDLESSPFIDSDEQLLNYKNIKVNEYIGSAIYLWQTGNEYMATKIFDEVNNLNPTKISCVLKQEITNNNEIFKKIYQVVSTATIEIISEKTYESFCSDISRSIRMNNYVDAIKIANTCANKYPGHFSVHVYCGDAKMNLNDKKGAEEEYRKALINSTQYYGKRKLIYYGKAYNSLYFPHADIYLKLNDKEKVIEILQDAVKGYKNMNIPSGIAKAESYLSRIENNEVLTRIE